MNSCSSTSQHLRASTEKAIYFNSQREEGNVTILLLPINDSNSISDQKESYFTSRAT